MRLKKLTQNGDARKQGCLIADEALGKTDFPGLQGS